MMHILFPLRPRGLPESFARSETFMLSLGFAPIAPPGMSVNPMANTDMMAGGANKMVAMIGGAVLALVGLLGFVNNPILGLFHVNAVHNVVHLLSGIVLLGAAFMNNGANARITLLVLGVVYAIVAIAGFALPDTFVSILGGAVAADLMMDNVLHVLLAVVFIAVPLLVKEEATKPMTGRPQM